MGLKKSIAGNYEKWIWIELIHFDKKEPDLGVGIYFKDLGFKPDALSILVSSPDFVHLHDSMVDEQLLDYKYCAMFCRPGGTRWTKKEIKDLIRHIHEQGVKVYLGLMGVLAVPAHGMKSEWADAHRETLVVDKNGSTDLTESGRFGGLKAINPLSRFRDGTYYQDFFAEKLVSVLNDYQFDGFHGADGFKALMKTLEFVPYSDDMIRQFEERLGIKIPSRPAGEDLSDVRFQSNWLWQNRRQEWIRFNTDRWTEFWETVVKSCRKYNKDVVKNSAWPTGPVDAIQKFGVDYKRHYEVGVEKMIFEAADGAISLLGGIACPDSETPGGYFIPWQELMSDFSSAMMLIKAYIPSLKIVPFTMTHDTYEKWDVLRHARTYLEKHIYSYTQSYYINPNGAPERCGNGDMVCLGHDIYPEEWKWLKERWDASFSVKPCPISGPVLVWSENGLKNEIQMSGQEWGQHRILYNLMAAGLPVIASANILDIDKLESDLFLIINPGSLSEEDKSIISKKISTGSTIAILGRIEDNLNNSMHPIIEVKEPLVNLKCQLYGPSPLIKSEEFDELLEKLRADKDIFNFENRYLSDAKETKEIIIHRKEKPLPYDCDSNQMWHFLARTPPARIPDSFLGLCRDIIGRLAWKRLSKLRVLVSGNRTEDLNGRGMVFYFDIAENEMVLFAENNTHRYLWLVIELDRKIAKVIPMSQYFNTPEPEDNKFDLVVPPNGALPVRVRFG